jgi:hypothetical protein
VGLKTREMELQLNVNVRYAAQRECIADVLRHFESPAWVRLVLRRVLPQLGQVSPMDPAALTKMLSDVRPNCELETPCAICLGGGTATSTAPLELPCGHSFHCGCAQSWLTRRSTCPLCRFQLPQAYTGTFAITAVQSTLLLAPEHDGLAPSELASIRTDGQTLQAAVTITMTRISISDAKPGPCQVRVSMTHANGSSTVMPHGKRRREGITPDAPDTIRDVSKRLRL